MELPPSAYFTCLRDEASHIQTPSGSYRLVATRRQIEECFQSILSRINLLSETADSLGDATDYALELTSYLYAAGAEHTQWRRWSALAAIGLALQKQNAHAACYAAVAGDWRLVDELRSQPPGRSLMPAQLWSLLGGASTPENTRGDDLEQAWNALVESVPSRDHVRTQGALREIVEWWWGEGDDWTDFHPFSYPDFDAPICAAAAIAKRYGYRTQDLSTDVSRYLEAGLADGYPESLHSLYMTFL